MGATGGRATDPIAATADGFWAVRARVVPRRGLLRAALLGTLTFAAILALLPQAAAWASTSQPIYTALDSLEAGGPTMLMEDMSGGTAVTLGGTNGGNPQAPAIDSDQSAVPILLPFPFEFYTNSYTQLRINNNGYITFSSAGVSDAAMASPQNFPYAPVPNDLIAGCWQDYKASTADGGSISYKTFGASPNQVFVVAFTNVAHDRVGPATAPKATFQIKLFEANDNIEVHFSPTGCQKNTNNGNSVISTIPNVLNCSGIEDSAGARGISYFCGDAAIQNKAVRYVIRNSSPVPAADTATAVEDGPAVTVNVVANDMDPDSHPIWITAFDATSARGGSVVRDTLGTPALTDDRLTYAPPSGFCGTDSFSYTIQDRRDRPLYPSRASALVTVTVSCVNDAPDFTPGAAVSALEDAGAVTVAGWSSARTPGGTDEAGQTVDVVVVSNSAPSLFLAGPTVESNGDLEFELAPDAHGVATVQLRAEDNGGTANGGVDQGPLRTLTITVTSVNDEPSFTAGGDISVVEDAGPQSVVWASGISAGPANEASQTLTFLVSGGSSLFSVPPAIDATGRLTFTPAPDWNGAATLTVSLRDNGGTANGGDDRSASTSFQIEVRPVNDAPSLVQGPNVTVPEDAGAQSFPGWLVGTATGGGWDEQGNQTVEVFVASSTPAGLFAVDPFIDAAGTLTFTPIADAGGVITVTLRARDDGGVVDGGQELGAPQTFRITIVSQNDAPVFAPGPAIVEVLEDSGAASLVWATGVGPGGGLDEAGQALTFDATFTNPALFAAAPVLGPTGVLTFTPVADANGVSTLTVRLRDNGGVAGGGADATPWTSFEIRVRPVNDAPRLTRGNDVVVLGNGVATTFDGWATGIARGGGPDEAVQALTAVLVPDVPALFAAAPTLDTATGDLTLVPAAGAQGNTAVTLTLRDNGGTADGGSDSRVVTFLVGVGQDILPPRADFRVDIRGFHVAFLDHSFDPTGQGLQRTWDFGDGSPTTSMRDPVHTYAAAGLYTVELKVVSTSGIQDRFVMNVAVGDGAGSGPAPGPVPVPGSTGAQAPAPVRESQQVDRPPVVQVARGPAAEPGATVELDASRSTDPEGKPLLFRWRQTGGDAVVLVGADGAVATFRAPDTPQTLVFVPVVSDGVNTVEGPAVRVTMAGATEVGPEPTVQLARAGNVLQLRFDGVEPVEWTVDGETFVGAQQSLAFGPGTHIVRVRDGAGHEATAAFDVPAPVVVGNEPPATLDEVEPAPQARLPSVGWAILAALVGAALVALAFLLVARRR